MSRDHTQEALDEYYSTGIDPTGGELGPDFDPETGRLLSEMEEPQEEQETVNVAEPGGTLMENLDRLEAFVDARLTELKREESKAYKKH